MIFNNTDKYFGQSSWPIEAMMHVGKPKQFWIKLWLVALSAPSHYLNHGAVLGVKSGSGGVVRTVRQIPRAKAHGIWLPVSHAPSCIVTTNPDRSVLITIITWHFQFRPVNVSIFHLKYDYRARSESHFACYSHCYVTWYPLTTGIVIFQIWRSSRHSRLPHRRAHYSSEQVHPDRPVWGQSSKLLPCTYSQLRLSVFSYISFMESLCYYQVLSVINRQSILNARYAPFFNGI